MHFEKLDLNLLVAIDALIEERSVSAAAQRLHLSQPALSGALKRLRDYFGDDLLVPQGRQMMLTPKAEELRGPVREALSLIRARITTPLAFDPATAQRRFSIVASDYAFNVLLAAVFAEAAEQAPGISFEIVPTDKLALIRLERGESDLVITITGYLHESHPRRFLFDDEHAVICWSESRYRDKLTIEDYFAASHVVAYFGPERQPAFTESHLASQGVSRRIEVRLPSFSSMPQAVIGTQRIATMYRRHAEYFSNFLPIVVHPAPIDLPRVTEDAQWHKSRDGDQGLRWLINLIVSHAEALNTGR